MEFTVDLNIVWFILIGVLLSGYAILDGFDLGVGAVYLFVEGDENRRTVLNSIGPVWDGNEVWLVTGGGALFAAFPHVYATVFSGFYTFFIVLMFSLIFRAVAIEFRSKHPSARWRQLWDWAFSVASIAISYLMGVALGNMVTGIPLGVDKEFAGQLTDLVNPYSLMVGVTTVALFMMHGTIYVIMKTEGDLQNKLKSWVNDTIIFFVICFVLTTNMTLVYFPAMSRHFVQQPLLFIVPVLNMLAIANIPREIHLRREFRAFLSSAAAILSLMALFAIGLFPNMVLSNPEPALSLTIYNAASSQKTLGIMLIFALIGMPFILAYTISIYWVFRGKVKLETTSY